MRALAGKVTANIHQRISRLGERRRRAVVQRCEGAKAAFFDVDNRYFTAYCFLGRCENSESCLAIF